MSWTTPTPTGDGEVALFAGGWLSDQAQAALCEGDLVLVLTAPDGESPPDDEVDVEMLLAHGGRWMRVGAWERMDPRDRRRARGGIHPGTTEVTGRGHEVGTGGVEPHDTISPKAVPHDHFRTTGPAGRRRNAANRGHGGQSGLPPGWGTGNIAVIFSDIWG